MINFRLKKIFIQGFRSFQEEQAFILDRKPGLYFIGGINKKNPKLGSNAVGKSTIWDAVIWCLFGKTIEGLRGHVIKNTKSNITKVSLELLRDNIFYTITRTHAPNSLTISPSLVGTDKESETISQSDLDQFLGLDYDKFLYTMVVGQFNSAFLELDPMVKLKIFSSIMDFSLWEKCAKAASTFSTNSITNKNLLETKLEGIQSRLVALNAERDRQDASYEAFQKDRDGQIQILRVKVDETLSKALELEKKLDTNQLLIKDLEWRINLKNTTLNQFNKSADILRKQYAKLSETMADLRGEQKYHQTDFNKWKDLNICPYCTQQVETYIVSSHKKEHIKQILSVSKRLKILETESSSIWEELNKLQNTDIAANNSDLIELNNNLDTIRKINNKLDLERGRLVQSINQYKESIEDLKRGTNPFKDLIAATEHGIAVAEDELKAIQSQIDVLNKEYIGMNFWVKGFKELRLWIMTDALEALAIETNNAISKLGLPDWRVKFQMERETSTGDISKGFHVMIHSPEFENNNEYVKFNAFSGGERQRLKLGGAIGFGSLIQDYKGVRFNISVWDEPTSFLSTEGIEDLIQCLHEDAITNDKIIYIVDQRHLENALFESVLTVEMTNTGSHILEGV